MRVFIKKLSVEKWLGAVSKVANINIKNIIGFRVGCILEEHIMEIKYKTNGRSKKVRRKTKNRR